MMKNPVCYLITASLCSAVNLASADTTLLNNPAANSINSNIATNQSVFRVRQISTTEAQLEAVQQKHLNTYANYLNVCNYNASAAPGYAIVYNIVFYPPNSSPIASQPAPGACAQVYTTDGSTFSNLTTTIIRANPAAISPTQPTYYMNSGITFGVTAFLASSQVNIPAGALPAGSLVDAVYPTVF